MRLKELAERLLFEQGDFEICFEYGNNLIANDIWYTYNFEKLKVGYFRFSEKAKFSLKIDEQEIPFATVKRRLILPYKVKVEILPCMIPQALEALASTMQEHPVISNDYFSKQRAIPYVREIKAVQNELYKILNSTLLENKDEKFRQFQQFEKERAGQLQLAD